MSFFSQSSHWYRLVPDGIEPCHDIGLKEARILKAFPSITTILKERANPALEIWKQNQLFEAITKNKRKKGESDEDYRTRISEIAGKKGNDAADFGTRLHDALDIFPQMTIDGDLRPYVDAFGESYDKIVTRRFESEIMLADAEIGVAGRTDLIAETKEWGLAVIDYKTSKFKYNKASFWPSYRLQLAFYAKCYQKKHGLSKVPRIVNCGINSETPLTPQWKCYSEEEQQQAYSEFLATAYLWFCTKNYWPVSPDRWVIHAQINGKLHSA